MTVRIGIDTGGTFTDVVAVDAEGRVVSTKVPSTPSDPSVAFMRAVEKAGTGEVVGHHEAPAYVVASGTVVASSTSTTTFHFEGKSA